MWAGYGRIGETPAVSFRGYVIIIVLAFRLVEVNGIVNVFQRLLDTEVRDK